MGKHSRLSTSPKGEIHGLRNKGLYAVDAYVDLGSLKLTVELYCGIHISVHISLVQGIHQAASSQLLEIEISPSGLGLHFPKLDADISIAKLLEGVMGSPIWMEKHQERASRLVATP